MTAVYVASPSGFCDNTRDWLRDVLLPKLSGPSLEIIDPWEHVISASSSEIRESAKTMTHEEAMAIGKANIESIDRSDVVFAVLDGMDVDSGVATEIGYAYGRGKRVIGYRGDCRFATEVRSCRVNMQVETFIERSGGRVHDSLEDAILELRAFAVFKQGAYGTEDEAFASLEQTSQGG